MHQYRTMILRLACLALGLFFVISSPQAQAQRRSRKKQLDSWERWKRTFILKQVPHSAQSVLVRRAYQACMSSSQPSSTVCALVGASYLKGSHKKARFQMAARFLNKACKLRDGWGCWLLAKAMKKLSFQRRRVRRTFYRARTLLRQRCSSKRGFSCYIWGTFLLQATSRQSRWNQVKRSFQRGCRSGDKTSCASLGRLSALGLGGRKDPSRAVKLFRTSCQAGSALGCMELGLALLKQKQTDESSQARRLLERSCSLHWQEGCARLGLLLLAGRLGSSQTSAFRFLGRGLSYLRSRCLARDTKVCLTLGTMLQQGLGTSKDWKQAQHFFGVACSVGSSKACKRHAFLYFQQGEQAYRKRKEYKRAYRMFSLACQNMYRPACKRMKSMFRIIRVERKCLLHHDERFCLKLAQMYWKGNRVLQDKALARSLFFKACVLESGYACWFLANLRGVFAMSPFRRKQLYQRSCWYGYKKACRPSLKAMQVVQVSPTQTTNTSSEKVKGSSIQVVMPRLRGTPAKPRKVPSSASVPTRTFGKDDDDDDE